MRDNVAANKWQLGVTCITCRSYWRERQPPRQNCWPHSLFWKRGLSASVMASCTALVTHCDGFLMLASRLMSLNLSICVASAPTRRPEDLLSPGQVTHPLRLFRSSYLSLGRDTVGQLLPCGVQIVQ